MDEAVALVIDDTVYCNDHAEVRKCGHVAAGALRNVTIGSLVCFTCIAAPVNVQTVHINKLSQTSITISDGNSEKSNYLCVGPKQFSIPIKPELNYWYLKKENVHIVEDDACALSKEGFLAMVNKNVPIPYAVCGILFFALFAAFLSVVLVGIGSERFLFNPIYAFFLALGFFGMFITCVVATVDWRKRYGEYRREKRNRTV